MRSKCIQYCYDQEHNILSMQVEAVKSYLIKSPGFSEDLTLIAKSTEESKVVVSFKGVRSRSIQNENNCKRSGEERNKGWFRATKVRESIEGK